MPRACLPSVFECLCADTKVGVAPMLGKLIGALGEGVTRVDIYLEADEPAAQAMARASPSTSSSATSRSPPSPGGLGVTSGAMSKLLLHDEQVGRTVNDLRRARQMRPLRDG